MGDLMDVDRPGLGITLGGAHHVLRLSAPVELQTFSPATKRACRRTIEITDVPAGVVTRFAGRAESVNLSVGDDFVRRCQASVVDGLAELVNCAAHFDAPTLRENACNAAKSSQYMVIVSYLLTMKSRSLHFWTAWPASAKRAISDALAPSRCALAPCRGDLLKSASLMFLKTWLLL